MTRDLVAVSPDTEISEVVRTLSRHRISGVAVVDADGHLLGFISESDIIEAMMPAKRSTGGLFVGSFLRMASAARDIGSCPAKDFMTHHVDTVTEDDDLSSLADLMLVKGYRIVPVTRDDRRLIGFVTRTDLCAALMAGDTEGE